MGAAPVEGVERAALARLEPLQSRRDLFGKWISVVDLRAADKTVVRLTNEAADQMAQDDKTSSVKAKKKAGQT